MAKKCKKCGRTYYGDRCTSCSSSSSRDDDYSGGSILSIFNHGSNDDHCGCDSHGHDHYDCGSDCGCGGDD